MPSPNSGPGHDWWLWGVRLYVLLVGIFLAVIFFLLVGR